MSDDPLTDRASEDADEERGWAERVRDNLPDLPDASAVTDQLPSGDGSGSRAAARTSKTLASPTAKKVYVGVGVLVLAVVAFAAVAQSRGLLNAIVYSMLFVFAATGFPVLINLLGGATPNSIGKLHLLLGAVAFDHHYLVQREHGWDWCPGERGRVWIDSEWHDVTGVENYSVLGWRPFGILRYKEDSTWSKKRADRAGRKQRPSAARERDPSADGGTTVVERGGIKEIQRPEISGVEGTWLLDLKRIYTNGVRKMGDVELIETAEEVIERAQVEDGKMASAGPVVETVGGIILGIIAGYGYLFLSG